MLLLELAGNMQEKAVYNYFPEGKKEYGTVSVNKSTGELDVEKVSVNDEHKRYLCHAISRIEKYFAENNFQDKDIVAWY